MKNEIIFFLIVSIILVFAILFSYTPIYKLTKKQREYIKKVGINHFTNYSAANSIVKGGFVCKPADFLQVFWRKWCGCMLVIRIILLRNQQFCLNLGDTFKPGKMEIIEASSN